MISYSYWMLFAMFVIYSLLIYQLFLLLFPVYLLCFCQSDQADYFLIVIRLICLQSIVNVQNTHTQLIMPILDRFQNISLSN